MDLSIIVVSFNTKDLLERCLESIVGDPIKPEIFVVDNASTDGSVEMIRKKFPKVRLIKNKENTGFARAINQGLREAKGENMLLLNSDTQAKKNALKELLDFEKASGPAIIGAKMLNKDGTVQASVFYLPTLRRAILEYWLGKKGYFSKYSPVGNKAQKVEAVSGGVMLIPKTIIEKIGMLDEKYFMYFEDLDYCRRAGKAGFKIFYLPSAEVVHEHGASGRSLSAPQDQWRRLIPSSKIYHGHLRHCLITLVIWVGQKWEKIFGEHHVGSSVSSF